ncbi:hypothetical protein M1720_04775 [Salmonella enterica subsp. enterica serovar Sandiego]|nr:hypothetical protein [Salmonella enterica]MCT7095594.1 hypothetical protein [Salmonella enterica subsp. enterica serovar Sandiego]
MRTGATVTHSSGKNAKQWTLCYRRWTGRNVRRSRAGNSDPGPAATSLNHAEYQRRELPVKRET